VWKDGGVVTSLVRGGLVDRAGIARGWRLVRVKCKGRDADFVDESTTKGELNAWLMRTRSFKLLYLLTFEAPTYSSVGDGTPTYLQGTAASRQRAALTSKTIRKNLCSDTETDSSDGLSLIYDAKYSCILTNQVQQEPRQRVLFEDVCDLIVQSRGFYRIMEIKCMSSVCSNTSTVKQHRQHRQQLVAWK